MKRRKKIIILLVLVCLGLALLSTFKHRNSENTITDISYTELLQKIDNNEISSIEIVKDSTQITATSLEASTKTYITEVPNQEVFIQYAQDKILSGQNLKLSVVSNDDDSSKSNILLAFLSLLPSLLYLGFMSFLLISTFKRMKNSKPNESFGIFGGSAANFEITESNVRFSDIAGLDEEKNELIEVVDFINNPQKYIQLGAKIPKGVLLSGAPGTGKTLLAKAVAGEAGIPFVAVSGSYFVEKFVGEGAARVRELFKFAKKHAPCIIFIDEIDAVGGKRFDDGNSERYQTLNELLSEMDGFSSRTDILVIAATNRPDTLDPALTRAGRFNRKIEVHLPDLKAREEILRVHGRNKSLNETIDLKVIATNTAGLAGADLENILNEAAMVAARKNNPYISKEDIDEAFKKTILGLEKVGRIISDKEKRITAVHEAGHAITALFSETQADVKEISIIPRGRAGGYTLHEMSEDKTYASKKELTERLTVLLGGRAAEHKVICDISSGASNDLEVATKLAREMIIVYGMDPDIGPISLNNFSASEMQTLGNSLLDNIDNKAMSMLKNAQKEAEKILKSNEEFLTLLVQKLLEQETVTGEELKAMKATLEKSYNN